MLGNFADARDAEGEVAALDLQYRNQIEFAVGLLLTTFGTFWAAEGAGASWPGGDAAILGLLALYAAASLGMVRLMEARAPRPRAAG